MRKEIQPSCEHELPTEESCVRLFDWRPRADVGRRANPPPGPAGAEKGTLNGTPCHDFSISVSKGLSVITGGHTDTSTGPFRSFRPVANAVIRVEIASAKANTLDTRMSKTAA